MFWPMHPCEATIRYVAIANGADHQAERIVADCNVAGESAGTLVVNVLRESRRLRAAGASILYTEIRTDGIARRYYPSGRVKIPKVRR